MTEPPAPPGRTTAVTASRALVLAPHYDDEVLGCGGLVAQLTAGGSRVEVLFLSDGGGGVEEVADRDAYRELRREEATAAVAVLGVSGAHHLGLPDGGLQNHREAISEAVGERILELGPELLLVPSPLEATADHRSVFAAVFELLHPLREGELYDRVSGLEVFLFEVNHPAYPDLLVDVSGEVGILEEAMGRYRSQQERHDYLGAALGLRRYRALSLPPEVEAAEGYRRLGLDDFRTRSRAGLIRALGGAPEVLSVREGPQISLLVRTCDRPELLSEALQSVAASSYRRAEVVVVNDGGAAPELPGEFPLPLRRVDLEERRGRAGAANAGVATARGDAIAFLDDDDLVEPEHLATLAGLLAAPGVAVAYTDAAVGVYELAGEAGWRQVERRLPYSRDFDRERLLVDNYIPFNTLLVERRLYREVGPFDEELPFFEDWELLIRLSAAAAFHHLGRVTCEYRHFRGAGHHALGERARERSGFLEVKARVIAKHRHSLGDDVLARVVDGLRAEVVAAQERARGEARRATAAAAQSAAARRAQREAEEGYHRLHGQVVALGADQQRLQEALASRDAEVRRLQGEEHRLGGDLEEQLQRVGELYAEIERLNAIVREMESTRAWRLHQWWQGRRG